MLASFSEEYEVGCRLIPKSLGGNRLPWWLSLEIRLVSCLIPILNYFLSPQRLARLLEPRRQYPPLREQYPLDLACHIGRLLQRQRFQKKKLCIIRSYLLYRFLRRFGYPAILNFGLMGDHREEGHCWITLNGEVFFDETAPDKKFVTQVAVSENVTYWI